MDGSLFLISRADIFSIYPKIFKELLANDDADRQLAPSGRLPKDFFNLPSDYEWKLKVYFRLLEMQRKLNEAEERGEPPKKLDTLREVQQWDDAHSFANLSGKGRSAQPAEQVKFHLDDPIKFIDTSMLSVWDLSDIAKAGMLLRKPKIPCSFENEHEMRRVYSLIYDVFRFRDQSSSLKQMQRYHHHLSSTTKQLMLAISKFTHAVKIVLSQALKDASFLVKYEQLTSDVTRVWLLLFDLHMRHFEQRDPEETIRKLKLFESADLLVIDGCLWQHRVRLAAALSRLRIKNGTLSLCDLLPPHLQDEKVAIASANPIVSGWINPFVYRTKELFLDHLNHRMHIQDVETLETTNCLQFDPVCPLFVQCLPENRGEFAQTDLVKKFQLVFQDRAFSIGPAICSRLLDVFEICGDVVQTHVSSPRSTAYLASLFFTNSRIKAFLAFGAGKRVQEYRQFMLQLGITNVKVFAENFTEVSLKSNLLERAVGVFASPPNSYSGVTDPIDLICSRGGDLTMLEVLTESEISDSGKVRVAQVLQEQRETLRLAMSRPQIQFVLYETHSLVSSENEEMVERAVRDINRAVNLKHYYAHKERMRQEALAAQQDMCYVPNQSPTATPNSSRKKTQRQSFDQQVNLGGVPDSYMAKSDTEDEGEYKSEVERENDENGEDDCDDDGRQTAKSLASSRKSNTMSCDEDPGIIRHPINIPPTDLFEIGELPDICLNQDQCLRLKDHGCFLSLMRRKEITKFDSKYLIKMAETRGLFGDSKPKTARTKVNKKQEQKEAEDRITTRKLKRKKSDISVLINRLTTPTLAFLNQTHSQRRSSALRKVLYYDPIRCRCLRYMWLNSNSHHTNCSDIGGYDIDRVDSKKSAVAFYSQAEDRACRWWRDTVDFLSRLAELRKKHRFTNLFQPVRDQKVRKLRLPRTIKLASSDDNESSLLNGKRYANSQPATRIPYPLSVSYLELDQCSQSLIDFPADDIDLEEMLRLDSLNQTRPIVHYMTQYIKQGTEEPIYYSLFY